jgi:hypothetical protein
MNLLECPIVVDSDGLRTSDTIRPQSMTDITYRIHSRLANGIQPAFLEVIVLRRGEPTGIHNQQSSGLIHQPWSNETVLGFKLPMNHSPPEFPLYRRP